MRGEMNYLLTVAYGKQSLAPCPVRAVEQYIRIGSAVRWDVQKETCSLPLRMDPGVRTPPEDLSVLGRPNHQGSLDIGIGGRGAPGILYIFLPLRGYHFGSVSGRKSGIYHAAGVLGATQHRLEVHALKAGGGLRFGIARNYERDLEKQFQHITEIYLSEQS